MLLLPLLPPRLSLEWLPELSRLSITAFWRLCAKDKTLVEDAEEVDDVGEHGDKGDSGSPEVGDR